MNDIFSIIACVGVVIYFVSKHFQNGFLILIIRFTVVIITLSLAIFTLNGLLQRITKGILLKIT